MSSYFVVGSGRSATTALITALSLSEEATCLSEPFPHLNEESRAKYEGFLGNPHLSLHRHIGPRVANALDRTKVYIEKQISLVPFMRDLHRHFGARFIISYRDGRDVVASLLNWHRNRYPIIYREAHDARAVSEHAKRIESQVIAAGFYDSFDYSLPRPVRGDPHFDSWSLMDHFEMCCWYWNAVYDRIFVEIEQLPEDAYVFIRTDDLTVDHIRQLYRFCGLSDFDEKKVVETLDRRINSLGDHGEGAGDFPYWTEWSQAMLMRYYDLCWRSYSRLGLSEHKTRPVPESYGEYWREKGPDIAWYKEIFEYRKTSHEMFSKWVKAARDESTLSSALEIGVGIHDYYRNEVFKDWRFTGIDLLPSIVDWLKMNANPEQRFIAADISSDPIAESVSADLVYSHASIDNVPDVDAFLTAAAAMTRNVLFISNYRGYFPELNANRILFDGGMNVAFNDISPKAVRDKLVDLGFKHVEVLPVITGRADIQEETVVIASRHKVGTSSLRTGLSIGRTFRPYAVEMREVTKEELAEEVSKACMYYSDPVTGCAMPMQEFEKFLFDLIALNRPLQTLKVFATQRLDASIAPIGLRVDIDDDLAAALLMAKVAAKVGIYLTFFILPTAPYYGRFVEGTFFRNSALIDYVLEIQQLGHEIGLHVDALHYYCEYGVDGAEATRCELEYLRAHGVHVEGITGHNCASHYGAENVEIFDVYNYSNRQLLERDGVFCPLGVLRAEPLGVYYEGSFFRVPNGSCDSSCEFVSGSGPTGYVTSTGWMRKYLQDNEYLIYGSIVNVWVTGRNKWVYSRHDAVTPVYMADQGWSVVLEQLSAHPSDTLIVLHPNYFGMRAESGESLQ